MVAPQLIRSSFKKVRKAARHARADGTAAAHHALRRRAKQLRYTIEAFDGFYDDEARKLLRALARLQSCLGLHQDAHVAAGRLQALATLRRNRLPSETLFLMGVLSERRRARAAESERRVRKRYAKLRGRRWKDLCRAMDDLSRAQGDEASRTRSAPARSPSGA